MSLRNKMIITLLAIMAFSLLSYYGIFRTIIIRSFIDLDEEYARKDIERFNAALERDLGQLNAFTHDWSSWDDTCRFIDGTEKDYETANLTKVTFEDQKLNLIHVYDVSGRLVWGKFYDLARDEELPLDLKAALGTDAFHKVVSQNNPTTSTRGVIATRYGVMLISSNPVLTSQNEGPSHGAFVMGRLFTKDMLSMLSRDLSLKLDAWPAGATDLPPGIPEVIKSFADTDHIKLSVASPEEMHAYSLIRDVSGRPALLIRASIPRDIMMKGEWTTRLGIAFTTIVGLLTFMTVSLMLYTLFLKPVTSLKEKVTSIEGTQRNLHSLETGRQDEIGTLSHEFSALVQRLSKSEERYRDSIESIQDAYLEVDLQGNLLYFNESLCRTIERTSDELRGRNFKEFVSPDIASDIYTFFHEVFVTGTPSTLQDFEVIRKDGTTVAAEFSVSLMRDEAGKPSGFRVTGRDVSERKQAAQEREQLIVELQQALAEVRTLSGMLPICASCKKIRDDKGYWNQIESYISEHSAAVFSHSICPDCYTRLYPYLKDK